MAKFRRIVQAVRETINWLNLPFDIHTILSYARKLIWPVVLAVLTGAIGFFRDAPFAQVVVAVVLVFVVVYIFVWTIHHLTPFVRGYLRQKGLADSADTGLQADAPLRKSTQDWWRGRIKEWRSVILDYDLDRQDDRRRFLRTDTYSQMRQHLRPEVVEMFEAQRTLHVGNEARGETAYTYTLLDEVARIERERVLNTPGSITNQATPGKLKALCFHLADELDDEHRSYLNSEQMVMLWEQELKEQGVSESEIDQKAESARDEHLVETLNRYNEHLKDRLLNLHDALGPQGWFGAIDRSRFENLSDPHYMSNLAKRLREVGGKLPDS